MDIQIWCEKCEKPIKGRNVDNSCEMKIEKFRFSGSTGYQMDRGGTEPLELFLLK
jgi:hypothetical protein